MTVPARTAEAAGSSPASRRTGPRRAVALAAAASWMALAVAGIVFAGGFLISTLAGAIALVPRAIVWLALAAQDGAGWWAIAGRAASALAAALTTPQALAWLIGIEIVGLAALAGLHRMLRAEMRETDSKEDDR